MLRYIRLGSKGQATYICDAVDILRFDAKMIESLPVETGVLVAVTHVTSQQPISQCRDLFYGLKRNLSVKVQIRQNQKS
jgi:hypothetical protein